MFRVPLDKLLAGRLGTVDKARVPLVIVLAGRLGTVDSAKVPLAMRPAEIGGISEDVKVVEPVTRP